MTAPSTRSVDRAIDLLTAVTQDAPVSLSDAARSADLPASTALRLLRTLEAGGLVARDDVDGLYRPGRLLIRLGAHAFTREPLVALSREPMQEVVRRTGESVYLAVQDTSETAVYLAILEGTHSVRHTNWVGRTIPLAGSAAGRALRGELPDGGSAVLQHTVEPDVTALSAPITVQGTPVGVLSVLVPSYRCTPEHAVVCEEALVAATAEVAHRLGA